jgi:hypothetical protein
LPAGATNRLGHVRFQELWSSADRLAEELGANPDLRVHLNPIRVRSRFVTTALLDDEASPPVDVLFFPVRNEISTAALERRGRALLKRLEASAPCTTSEWLHCNPRVGREEFLSFCRDLAEIGLAAFG